MNDFNRCGINIPLVVTMLLCWPSRLSSATAGVIPMEYRRSPPVGHPPQLTSESLPDLACPAGYFAATEDSVMNTGMVTCIMCSMCGCGRAMYNQNASMTCTLACANFRTCEAVENLTMGECFSLNGGGCLSAMISHHPVSPATLEKYDTISPLTTAMLETTGKSHSTLVALVTSIGIIAIIAAIMASIICYARHMKILPDVSTKCCFGATSKRIKRGTSPRGLFRRQYDRVKRRFTSSESTSVRGHELCMSVENIPLVPAALPLASEITVESGGGLDPYWLVMRGWMTPAGGVLHCEQSDVILEVPPGAIPDNIEKQEFVAKVALVTTRFDFKLRKNEDCLSPVVEFLSPGLEKFKEEITIKIPHRARLDPDWTFRVHYTHSHGQDEGGWHTVGREGVTHPEACECAMCLRSTSDVTFQVTGSHFIIRTPHFSKYVCSGCSKKRYLNLEAFISAKHTFLADKGQQVELKCYVADTIKDYWHRISEDEGQRPRSERHPIHLKRDDPLEVTLLTDKQYIGDDWPWQAHTYGGAMPTTHMIPLRNINRCCSDAVPYFVKFTLKPINCKGAAAPPESFGALVAYRQKGSGVNLTVSIDFSVRGGVPTSGSTPVPMPRRMTDHKLQLVAEQLPMDKWRYLCLILVKEEGGVEALISEMESAYRGQPADMKMKMLLEWKRRKGKLATEETMCQALRACGLTNIAEIIEDTPNQTPNGAIAS